jgi:hypothetical protein
MRPDQDLHKAVERRLEAVLRAARDKAQPRLESFDTLELLYLQYADPAALAEDGSPKNPHPRSIVVPYSLAAVQTCVSHWYTAWTMRTPWMSLRSLNPARDRAAEALEAVLDANHMEDLTNVKLWALLLDSAKWGQGRLGTSWRSTHQEMLETYQVPAPGLLGMLLPPQTVEQTVLRLSSEGQVNQVINPRCYFPDPNVPGWDPQGGNYVAIKSRRSISDLWRRQQEGDYFNIDHLLKKQLPYGDTTTDVGRLEEVPGQTDLARNYPTGQEDLAFRDVYTIYIWIMPRYWRTDGGQSLGNRTAPELWVFSKVGNVIIQAQPLEMNHGKFPIAAINSQLDVHTLFPPGDLEVIQGLQEHADFLYNSRQAQLRLGVYGALFYDPKVFEEADLLSSRPGIRARLRPGRPAGPISQFIHELNTSDTSSSYYQDLGFQGAMIEKALGAVDILQGIPARGERSATEMSGVLQNAQTRAGARGSVMFNQGMIPFGRMEISDAQQFMSKERWVRLTENAAKKWGLQDPRALISPDVIQDPNGELYVVPAPPNAPTNRSAMGQMWLAFAVQIAQDPLLSQQFDAVAMLKEGARLSGARNIEEFVKQPPTEVTVMPDEQVLAETERGNLRPMAAGGGNPFEQLLSAIGAGV